MAHTQSPTRSSSESPRGTGVSSAVVHLRITATSVLASEPTRVAAISRLSARRTRIRSGADEVLVGEDVAARRR